MATLEKRISALELATHCNAAPLTVEQEAAYSRLFAALKLALPEITPLGVTPETNAFYANTLRHDVQVVSLDDRMQANTLTPTDIAVLACLMDDELTIAKTTTSTFLNMMAGIYRDYSLE